MTLFKNALQIIPPGIWMIVLAVAFVGLRLWWIHVERPAHLDEIAATYGSIRTFYGNPQVNHDGSQFTYVAAANDRGRALFLCDSLTGKKRQIIEDKLGVGGAGWNDDFDIVAGPWSPDDSSVLCIASNRLMVCPIDPRQAQVVIEDKPFTEAVWLTPSKFSYVTDRTNLCMAQKRDDGQWERTNILSRNVPITPLTAIDSDTVAWLETGGVICRVSLSEGPPKADAVPAPTNNAAPLTSGLALWLDASKLQLTNLAPVTLLGDLSRSRNDAVWNKRAPVFNDTNSPLALNGLGTVHFGWVGAATNGTGLRTLFRPSLTGSAPRSVFAVMRHNANASMMVSMGDTTTNGTLFAVEGDRDRFYLPGGWYRDNQVMMTSTNWNLLEVTYDGETQRGYVNAVLRGVASVKLDTAKKEIEIGYRTATSGQNPKTAEGDFAELLVYDRALDDAERKQVEDYLGGKWFGKASFSSQDPLVWYETGLGGITGMTCSKDRGMLLLSSTEDGQDSVWRLDTASGANAYPVKVEEGKSVSDVQWAGTQGFAYASRNLVPTKLMFSDLAGGNKQLLGRGTFDWFKVPTDPKQVLLFGNISNQPAPGIWRYDMALDTLSPVISIADYPSVYAQPVIQSHASLKLKSGGNVNYTIFRPANFDPHKKYPLVLGDTVITDAIYGEPFMTGMAASGACVAVVERRWWPTGIEQWVQNVQGLYDVLKHEPAVDTRRVYLFGASAETQYLSQMVETNPAPWRGLILLNPSLLPDFSKSPWFKLRPKILLDAGGEEHEEGCFKQYQTNSLSYGGVVEFFTHPGETHRTVGADAKLERAMELKHFIFEE